MLSSWSWHRGIPENPWSSNNLPPSHTVSSLTRVRCLAVCQQLNQQDAIRPHIRLRRETSKQRRFRCCPFDGKLSTWNTNKMAHNPVVYKVKHRFIYLWRHNDGLVQERHNSNADTLELHLSCTNPSICFSYITSRASCVACLWPWYFWISL